MKVLFDTSTLVAALVEPHPMHGRALPWLKQAVGGKIEFFAAGHTLAELYAVLSTLPVTPRISTQAALRLIHENIEAHAKVITLTSKEYYSSVRRMADLGLPGGAIYDALIAPAAEKSAVDRLLTFNANDFRRVWPDGGTAIQTP